MESKNRHREKLGTYAKLLEKLNGGKLYEWAKKRVEELNKLEKESKVSGIQFSLSPSKKIKSGNSRLYNGDFIFLSKIYRLLGLNRFYKGFSKQLKTLRKSNISKTNVSQLIISIYIVF